MQDHHPGTRLLKQFVDWVFRKWKNTGLVVLAFLFAVVFVYTNWDKVRKWPGIDSIVSRITQDPVPTVDPDRFTVFVAHLDNDTDQEYEQLILDELYKLKGLKVVGLDRTISLGGPDPEEQENQGYQSALEYLRQSGAAVLIWGKVLSHHGETLPKIYLTASDEIRKAGRYEVSDFRLPEVFWKDLARVLGLLVASQNAEFCATTGKGHYAADRLEYFIKCVDNLLQTNAAAAGWNADARAKTRIILANAYLIFAQQCIKIDPLNKSTWNSWDNQFRGNRNEQPPLDCYKSLDKAIATYKQALMDLSREREPLDWAAAQNNLGYGLLIFGERKGDTGHFKDAIKAFEHAAKQWPRESVKWATAQNNLGHAQMLIGEREGDMKRIEASKSSFQEALKGWPRASEPLLWATAQNNLGNALMLLGERKGGTEDLKKAVSAFEEALEEWPRESVPMDWAVAKNNIGNAHVLIGEREGSAENFDQAISAFEDALKEWSRERVPFDWVKAQNSLGYALLRVGKQKHDAAYLKKAVSVFEKALKACRRDYMPLDWAAAQNNLGYALMRLGEHEHDIKHLESAVLAFEQAFKEWNRACAPLNWAAAQNNRGYALMRLGEWKHDTAYLKSAVSAFEEALKAWTREKVPLNWAAAQNNMGYALMRLGEFGLKEEFVHKSISACKKALEVWTRETVPLDWAAARNNYGLALVQKGKLECCWGPVEQAIDLFNSALIVFEEAQEIHSAQDIEANIRQAETLLDSIRYKCPEACEKSSLLLFIHERT
jgi:tetratricopeptide (TPR) repeat protein